MGGFAYFNIYYEELNMSVKDLHSGMRAVNALTSATIATNTTTNGAVIDTKGYNAVEFVIRAGTVTDGTYTPVINESDNADMSGSNAVIDDDLLGTEAGAVLDTTADVVQIGYVVGAKRYVRLSLVSAGTTTGATAMSAIALLGGAKRGPVN